MDWDTKERKLRRYIPLSHILLLLALNNFFCIPVKLSRVQLDLRLENLMISFCGADSMFGDDRRWLCSWLVEASISVRKTVAKSRNAAWPLIRSDIST